jgi:uncharacterized protein (DUF952 family)
MESEYIYHITSQAEWENAKKNNEYFPVNYEVDGFIHCSIERQIPGVLERFYQGQKNLVKLKIEKEKVNRPVLFELAHDINELFPHIYGSLNIDAVVAVESIS